MSTVLLDWASSSAQAGTKMAELIGQRISLVLQSCQPFPPVHERRRDQRRPYPYPVHLTPVGRHGVTPVGEATVVLGKHLSERGLDFYHRQPLPYGRVIASFQCGQGLWVGVLMDLGSCRFSQHGWYENGGRFLQVVPSPLEGQQTFRVASHSA